MPRFLSTRPNTRLMSLPWHLPLAEWPTDRLVALPRGISRHVVRFIDVGEGILAVKEIPEHLAMHEYRMLVELNRLGVPVVEPVAVVTNRAAADGTLLDPILITRHLTHSLPYRSLFSPGVRSDRVERLIDSLVLLLARLHLIGFMWRDISLSNTLFRRDANTFSAYVVDVETGEFHRNPLEGQPNLSDGQREHDIDIARTNLFGEFCDLESGGMLDAALDPNELVDTICQRYRNLWKELTAAEEFADSEVHRIDSRIHRLNDLGFDVSELDIDTTDDGSSYRIQPKIVDAGHHARRLLRLTGLETQENQAKRLLEDLDDYRKQLASSVSEEIGARRWLRERWEEVINAIPVELMSKLAPAQIYHEVLDHQWFKSEERGAPLPLIDAAKGYVDDVLWERPDEAATDMEPVQGRQLANPYDPSQGYLDENEDLPHDPWEDNVDDADPDVLDIDALRARWGK